MFRWLFVWVLTPGLLAAQSRPSLDATLAELDRLREYKAAVISPDGSRVAYVETQPAPDPKTKAGTALLMADLKSPGGAARRVTAGGGHESAPAWSPDGKRLAFLSDAGDKKQLQLYVVEGAGGSPKKITSLTGFLARPTWSPDGSRIALLFTANAPRQAGPLEAVTPMAGVLETTIYEQRIAVVDLASGAVNTVSPADLYVHEFDWSPDGKTFALTAAPGEGDANWWTSELMTLPAAGGAAKSLHKAPVQRQIAVPRWSPDGKSIAFVGGLMSDEGSTGGDVYLIPAAGGEARNVTPTLEGSAAHLTWAGSKLIVTEHRDGGSSIATLDPASGTLERVWQGQESITATGEDTSVSVAADGRTMSLVRQSFKMAPEVWAGKPGEWKAVSKDNGTLTPVVDRFESLHWTSGGATVQGWLLFPKGFDPSRKYPLVVSIHGGPASQASPAWPKFGFSLPLLAQNGYFVLLPNPRGSYGFGERFTLGNVKDFGGGDLQDILAGVDEVVKTQPVDANRVGVGGWSYGGFMTMWTVTQTHRFKAAVAGAGIANWQSYYGENAIDTWMIPYFGASVYDDPAVYAKSSPITFIKKVKTPTLVLVGDRDGECPPAQSLEFWRGLKAAGVKTQMVVYENEGHAVQDPEHRRDLLRRTIAWFDENMR